MKSTQTRQPAPLTLRALTEDERSRIVRAVHGIAEVIYYDVVNGAREAGGEKLTNLAFIDCIVDGMEWMQDNLHASARISPELMEKWRRIPYRSRVRWLNKDCRYI
jgi:hypothetical protein